MPPRRLPPYVQATTRKSGRRFRGWYTSPSGDKKFTAWRATPQEAHADAVRARGLPEMPSFGGELEGRAKQWLAAAGTSLTDATTEFYRGKLQSVYLTIPKTLPLERVTPAVLRQFVVEAGERGLSARTIQHCRRTLNRLFVWCVKRGFAVSNPVAAVDWPKPKASRPDVFTEPELHDALGKIDCPFARDLAVFIAYTGLRRAEVARLEIGHVDQENASLWIAGKTGDQSHPLAAPAAAAAERLAKRVDGPFLIAGATEAARCERIAETFRAWKKKLGEPRFHPHALRHSVATIMLRNGASPAAVQAFLRHTSYAMTQKYVHMVRNDVIGAMGKLRLLPGGEEKREHG